ncbi:MAG: universal stress protein [Bryobacterales bacterium]|nr:universal stress protein [Bryobacterales bacterium]
MAARPELELLFLTNYSDSSYQAIPAVAQLAASLHLRITLLHAYNPRQSTQRQADDQLHSFSAEAAQYSDCRRVVVPGPALAAVQKYAASHRFDLLVAPQRDRFGLPRIAHRSLRARLLQTIPAPLWTLGAALPPRGFDRPIRNIACRMNYGASSILHFKLAANLAERLDARLHLIDVVPDTDEATLLVPLYATRPLSASAAIARIAEHTAFMKRTPEIHVSAGNESRELRRLLERCEADLFFCGENQALRSTLLGPQLDRSLDSCGCPVIAADAAALHYPGWNLPLNARRSAAAPARQTLERGSLRIGA